VEDLFLGTTGRRNTSVFGASHSWPYQEVESLNFRGREEYSAMRDVYSTLSKPTPANKSLHTRLNKLSDASMDEVLAGDLEWRAEHLGETLGYWELVGSDIPYHLTQITTLETAAGPMDGPKPLNAQHVTQTLWNHPFYKSAQLVRNKLRCFHRHDGNFRESK
jgi:hypothetical protein